MLVYTKRHFDFKLCFAGFAKCMGLIAFLCWVHTAVATHIMGSDITYKSLGNNKYWVTLTIYRDCRGVSLGNTQELKVMSDSTRQVMGYIFPLKKVRDITGVGALCSIKSACAGGYFPFGIQEYTYEGQIDVSSFWADDVIMSWREEARNSTITTGAADQWFYTEAFLLRGESISNNSPVFTTPAATLICAGSDFVFNNGALDTLDGDSLSYQFAKPLSDKNIPIDYLNNWSEQKPVTYLGFPQPDLPLPEGIHLDPITGNINFRPMVINEATVMVLEVIEWRRVGGVMRVVGKTRRDIQVVVINCQNNTPPEISGQSLSVCANMPVDITIKTSDKNIGDSIKLSWNRGIADADFVSSAGTVKWDTAALHWVPQNKDIRTIPYIFTVTAKDNACPLSGQAVAAFYIFVEANAPKPVFTINDSVQCFEGHSFDFINKTDTGFGGYKYEWGLPEGQTETAYNVSGIKLQAEGTYTTSLKVKTGLGCADSTAKQFKVKLTPQAVISGLKKEYCLNELTGAVLADLTNGKLTGKNVMGNRMEPNYVGYDTIAYKITIDGCSADTAVPIYVHPLPKLDLGNDTSYCINGPISFDVSFPGANYLWHDGSTQPIYTAAGAGQFSVTLFHVCDTLEDEILVRDCNRVYIPTAFTPNADGHNDVFMPDLQNVEKMKLIIYDRWGGLVFATRKIGEGWDGKIQNGDFAPIGIYMWQLSVTFNNGGVISNYYQSGNVSLVR